MPISNTPKRVSFGMLASDSGTPQWLLNDLSEACTEPEGVRASFSASLVPVLPTLPVTAITTASLARARETRAEIVQRFERVGDAYQPLLASPAPESSGSTMAHEAPGTSAASTKRCPSRFDPRMATKPRQARGSGCRWRRHSLGCVQPSTFLPRTAFTISPIVHSGSATLCPSLQRDIDRVMIGVRNDGAFDDLSSLVALAGDKQDISLLEIGDGLGDRPRHGRDLRLPLVLPPVSRGESPTALRSADCRR